MNKGLSNKPILITGSHRSGTTLVGSILAESDAYYIYEPFNPHSPPGIAVPELTSLYHYLDGGAFPQYRAALAALCEGYFPPTARSRSSLRDRASLAKKSAGIKIAHLKRQRLLLKSSELMLSIQSFLDICAGHVVVTVRHPCAFILSCDRMKWRFNLDTLTSQHEFFQSFLRDEPEFGHCAEPNISASVIENTWLWYALHTYLLNFLKNHPKYSKHVTVTFHEHLCLNPHGEFARLCNFLNLRKSSSMNDKITKLTAGATVHVAGTAQHHLERNSHELAYAWRSRINQDVAQWVCKVAEPVFESLCEYSTTERA